MKKKGLASLLVISCINCEYGSEFYTSKLCGKGYIINCRTVYNMGKCGQGYILKDFVIRKSAKSAKLVAEETINDTAEELKGENVDNIVDIYKGFV